MVVLVDGFADFANSAWGVGRRTINDVKVEVQFPIRREFCNKH